MRRHFLTTLALGAGLLSAPFALAQTTTCAGVPGDGTPGCGINLTVHDLSAGAYAANPADNYTTNAEPRICIFCHAPHNSIPLSAANFGDANTGLPAAPDAFDYLPLWNHTLQTDLTYTPYYNGPGAPQTGPQSSQAIALGMTINGTSLLCLSCHDGSVAVNSYGNASQPAHSVSGGGATLTGSRFIIGAVGTLGVKSLQNHHPIGFSYDQAQLLDNGLRLSSHAMGGAGLVSDHLYGATGTMQCGTCHSVHNTLNTGESLLWRSDGQSRLCLTCHDKGADPGATLP
jgi:predicted CXXCH cytochrome family protein